MDLTVLPDGTGLPPGKGSAKEGAALYVAHCAACHGDHGEGRGDFPALIGGRGSLASDKPILTVGSYWPYASTLFDYIRRAMPYQGPGELSANDVYALTAWILAENEIVKPTLVLTEQTLPAVRMPNRDGFESPAIAEK
jgi:cytochrome c